jgi:hypothetical protein
MTIVDAFDVRAYTQLLFSVVSAYLDPDKGVLKVVVYKELADIDDVIRSITFCPSPALEGQYR